MRFKYMKIRIGLRTIKTAAAVLISMMIINYYGLSTSKMIFAMLGAMNAMEPTFKESWENCLTQFVGMVFGTIIGMILMTAPFPYLLDAGIGIVIVITIYNMLRIRYSPSLPCLVVVTMCITPDIVPLDYAIGRLWACSVGLSVGMLINALVFPYDNSNKIREIVAYLDKELLHFLEDMFDGDNHLPGTEKMITTIDEMASQLRIFSKQSVLLRKIHKREQLAVFKICEGQERQLLARMEVLCRMEKPGRLNEENRKRLRECGANIKDEQTVGNQDSENQNSENQNAENQNVSVQEVYVPTEIDIITNYHVKQILNLRQELMEELKEI